jgi:hypothetical protein
MARSFVLSVEVHRVPGHQATHKIRKISRSAVKKKMEMIRHEGPCQAIGIKPFEILQNPTTKFLSVILIQENIPLLDTPCVNMMKRSWEIDTRSPCHTGKASNKHAN